MSISTLPAPRRTPSPGPPAPHPPAILSRRDVPRTPIRWTVDPWPADPAGSFVLHLHEHAGPFPGASSMATWNAGSVEALRRDLGRVAPGEPIAVGAASDPYPPEEARFPRTLRILEALMAFEGLEVTLTTKSDLVTRDRDRLTALAERHDLTVDLAIPTLDRRLARALEPDAPRPDLRLKAASELSAAGVPVGVVCAPVLPGINDDPGGIDRLAEAAVGAGASWLAANALLLMPSAQDALFPALARELPDRVDRQRARYERGGRTPDAYRAGLADLVTRLRRKHGFLGRSPREGGPPIRGPQLDLF